jgi:hypothetical protein
MSKHAIRRGLATGVLIALAGVATPFTATAAEPAAPITRFSATTVAVNPGNGEKGDTLRVDVLRWSTDAERDQLVTALMKDEKQFGEALQKQPSLGYIWTRASVGFSIRYASRTPLPAGGERVVLVTDKPLHSGGVDMWKSTIQPRSEAYPFTLIELHTTRAGGEGKISIAGNVGIDPASKTLGLENYATAPVLLRGVKTESAAP